MMFPHVEKSRVEKTRTRPISALALAALLALVTSAAAHAGTLPPTFVKAFEPATIGPGSTSRLVFTITNFDSSRVTDLAFTDVLPTGMTSATPANASTTCGGTLSILDGGAVITFATGPRDGIAGGETCTLSVDVTSSTPGQHMNTSGNLSSSAGTSAPASADLIVATDRPGFSKAFAPSATTFGSTVTLTHTIDNTANAAVAFNLAFSDELPPGSTIASPANASTTCTGGTLTATPGGSTISYRSEINGIGNDASVAAGASCTVSVQVAAGAVGTLVSVSGELTSGTSFPQPSSGIASAALVVTASTGAPVLTKSFVDDPVPPGGLVTLEFSIVNPDREHEATSIAFIDDLFETLPGLSAVSLPATGFCGARSQITGTDLLIMSDASLAAGASCSFDVTLVVPLDAPNGSFTNTTTSVTAIINGRLVAGNPASNDLTVASEPLQIGKNFITNPIGSGGTVEMEFAIWNLGPEIEATDIAFFEELAPPFAFPIEFDDLPSSPCGANSALFPISLGEDRQGFQLTQGSLLAGGVCRFTVRFTFAAGTHSGDFSISTSPITATIGSEAYTGGSATDTLQVVGASLKFTKEFTDDPVGPSETATLRFTLTNTSEAGNAISGVGFTDDLAATLPGLVATGLPADGVCGTGSRLSGTTFLSLTGGNLLAGESCTFLVSLTVPGSALPGSLTSTTSIVTGTVSGTEVSEIDVASPAAEAELRIKGLALTKSFTDDPVRPGDTVTLEYTVENETADLPGTGIYIRDDLGATSSGLTVIPGSVPNPPCGPGSSITLASGNRLLTMTGGALAAGQSCAFSVSLQVPTDATPNSYTSATELFFGDIGGSTMVFDNAADHLVVAFAPNDQCVEATIVTDGGRLVFKDPVDTLLATVSATDPVSDCGLSPDGATVWYTYTPEIDGTTPVWTAGSDYDTVVSVWQGSEGCGSLRTQIACNDDDGETTQSWLEFESEAETLYLIQVGARNLGEGGDLFFTIPEPQRMLYSVAALAALGLLARRRGTQR